LIGSEKKMYARDILRDHMMTFALCMGRLLPRSPFLRRYIQTFVKAGDLLPRLMIAPCDDVHVYAAAPGGWRMTRVCRCHWHEPYAEDLFILIKRDDIKYYILNLQRVSS